MATRPPACLLAWSAAGSCSHRTPALLPLEFTPQGKLDAAIACYRRAIAAQPQFPEAYNNLGNALREAGRTEEAVSCYTACIHLQVAAAQAPLLAAGQLGLAGVEAKVGDGVGCCCCCCPGAYAGCCSLLQPAGACYSLLAAAAHPVTPHCPLPGARPPLQQSAAAQQAQRLSVAYNNLGGILKLTGRLAECIQCYEHVVYLQVGGRVG